MENLLKYVSGLAMSFGAFFAPIKSLIICATLFVGIDFITGVLASRKRARRAGEPWGFESGKAWNTVWKLCFVMAGIVLSWLIQEHMLTFVDLPLANIFTGFVCGIEFWSYLENAAEMSDHPLFRWLKQFMLKKAGDTLGLDLEKFVEEEIPEILGDGETDAEKSSDEKSSEQTI